MTTLNKNKQSGFAMLEIIILAVVVIGVLGFIGWSYFNHQPTKKAASVTTSSTSTSPSKETTTSATVTPQSTYLNIKELGIKLPLSNDIQDLVYTYDNKYGINYLDFSTNSIIAADPKCNTTSTPLGLYTVYTDQTNADATNNHAGTLAAHINGYYIYYRHAEFACGDNTTYSKVSSDAPSLLTAVQSAQAQ